jgi:taurine--2-oxoglutarate transaminase
MTTLERTEELTAEEIVDFNKEYTFFSWTAQGKLNPIPVTHAEGVYFWDANGKRYLDMVSQLANSNLGHQHPKVVKAIQDQAAKLTYISPFHATEPRALLGKKLAEITPGDLKKTFFTLGGSDANENAIKIARQYTGRHKILARYRSYHGATHGAVALTGDYRRLASEPSISGVLHFLDPYCYRCPFGWTKDSCKRQCISHVEEVIQHEGPDQIAAIFLEGVTGTNGLILPPDDYWPRMREICDKYGVRYPAHLRRSDERLGAHGQMVRCGQLERHARHHHHREGNHVRLYAARRGHRQREDCETFRRPCSVCRTHIQRSRHLLRGGGCDHRSL